MERWRWGCGCWVVQWCLVDIFFFFSFVVDIKTTIRSCKSIFHTLRHCMVTMETNSRNHSFINGILPPKQQKCISITAVEKKRKIRRYSKAICLHCCFQISYFSSLDAMFLMAKHLQCLFFSGGIFFFCSQNSIIYYFLSWVLISSCQHNSAYIFPFPLISTLLLLELKDNVFFFKSYILDKQNNYSISSFSGFTTEKIYLTKSRLM